MNRSSSQIFHTLTEEALLNVRVIKMRPAGTYKENLRTHTRVELITNYWNKAARISETPGIPILSDSGRTNIRAPSSEVVRLIIIAAVYQRFIQGIIKPSPRCTPIKYLCFCSLAFSCTLFSAAALEQNTISLPLFWETRATPRRATFAIHHSDVFSVNFNNTPVTDNAIIRLQRWHRYRVSSSIYLHCNINSVW